MRRILWVLLLALLCLPLSAGAAAFEIDSLVVEVEIAPDGSGSIEETIAYAFDDTYNGILLSIGHEGGLGLDTLRLYTDDGIELERVDTLAGVPYTYATQTDGERTSVRVFAPGDKGERVFRMTYRLAGLAQRYLDTARLNHVFLNSETAFAKAMVRVTLPGQDDAAIEAFVHGAMEEENLTVSQGVITLGPAPVDTNVPLELDVLFPAEWLPDARVIALDIHAQALAREAEIAAEREAEAQQRAQQARVLAIVMMAALVVYLVVALVLFGVLRRRYGLRQRIVPTTDTALLDDMTAAEAQLLCKGQVDASGMTATLLELTGKCILSMRGEGDDTVFTRIARGDGLAEHQQRLLGWLFADQDTLYISGLDAGEDAEAAKRFTDGYNAWKASVRETLMARGWVYDNQSARWIGILGVPVAGLAVSFYFLRQGIWLLGIPGAVVSVLLGVLFSRIRRLTDAGEAQMAAIDGFADNYADVLERDPQAVLERDPQAVLERAPLVMAMGYMKPLAAWVDTHPAQESYADTMLPYWMYTGWHQQAVRAESTVREAQSHNMGTQYGSDSGGGPSSGGGFSGGTGGGNSYGAW